MSDIAPDPPRDPRLTFSEEDSPTEQYLGSLKSGTNGVDRQEQVTLPRMRPKHEPSSRLEAIICALLDGRSDLEGKVIDLLRACE